ncbi:DUF2490 domain-containing protein [Sediminibacterium sp.]|uniref:DUF2490 domain-containing protein n=1 Tax=Sediminibacterium sp. TaxID=1917865 RepID=UPI003F6A2ABF
MKRIATVLSILCCLLLNAKSKVFAQNGRITDRNSIGWFNYFGTIKLKAKWSLHTEYQWRRVQIIKDWQQSLLRIGVNYQLNNDVQFRLGYAWAETFAYGDIPLNAFGKQFTEHRTYQMATINDKIGKVSLSHRFMLEQRWLGRYTSATDTKDDDFLFMNRMRYMIRGQIPLTKNATNPIYAAAYNEILIGFGKNVGENVFDQNRIGLLLGKTINNSFRIEAGYLNQIVQLGREVNNRNVFQYNNGVILNTYFNF